MNKGMVRYITARFLQIEALLLLFPLVISFVYQEEWRFKLSYLSVIVILVILGQLLSLKSPTNRHLTAREGVVIVALSWVLFSFFGALPFVFSGDIPSIIDAFFETSSGFTTSGSSILEDVEALSKSNLFWRSFTHLTGGMGILAFALAVLPKMDSQSVAIMKAEAPGPTFGKIVSKVSSSARILYIIYLAMTTVVFLLLWLGGDMDWFDSLLHAFGTAGTGGFGIQNGSVAPYQSAYSEWVIGWGMLAFGVNFNLYYLIIIGQVKQIFKSEELKWYLLIVATAVGLICVNLWSSYSSLSVLVRDVFFSVSSVITTTGFTTADYGQWPLFSQLLLLLLMFIGGSAGSTAGGLKVSRVVIYAKMFVAEVRRVAQPNRVVTSHYDQKPLSRTISNAVVHYLVVYVLVFIALVVIVSLDTTDFMTAVSAVAATFNNIGPGLGEVGPIYSFAGFNDFTTLMLSFGMIAGRLEIFPILILFAPRTWK